MAISTINYDSPAVFGYSDKVCTAYLSIYLRYESKHTAMIDSGEVTLTVGRLAGYIRIFLSNMVSGISLSQRFADMLWEKHIPVDPNSDEAIRASRTMDHRYNVIFYINGDEAYPEHDALLAAYGDDDNLIPAVTLYNRFKERYGSTPCRCNKCRDAF